jgi:hypothetical protein
VKREMPKDGVTAFKQVMNHTIIEFSETHVYDQPLSVSTSNFTLLFDTLT